MSVASTTTSTEQIKALAKRVLELEDEWTYELVVNTSVCPGKARYIAERLYDEGWRHG